MMMMILLELWNHLVVLVPVFVLEHHSQDAADLLDYKLLPLSAPQALAEAFLEHQWKILQSPSQPAVTRQAAASYLGSFLARAKFVPLS